MDRLFALRFVYIDTDTLVVWVHARGLICLLQVIDLRYSAMLARRSSLVIQDVLTL